MAQIPRLKVEIVDCHEQSLNEHMDDEVEQTLEAEGEQRTYETTRYIKSKTGAKFGIQRTFAETYDAKHGIRMEMRIDGRLARTMIDPPSDLRKHGGKHIYSFKHEYKNSKRSRRDFQFAAVHIGEMSDDDVSSIPARNMPAIGSISVFFYDVENVQAIPAMSPLRDSHDHKMIERLSEKSMKGDTRSHTVTYTSLAL
ncbi:hypothetical protein E8E11_003651 [Didymella keratinophila]|nr:hypothetical protein E8E11_003651 [Didymella keratinophila]